MPLVCLARRPPQDLISVRCCDRATFKALAPNLAARWRHQGASENAPAWALTQRLGLNRGHGLGWGELPSSPGILQCSQGRVPDPPGSASTAPRLPRPGGSEPSAGGGVGHVEKGSPLSLTNSPGTWGSCLCPESSGWPRSHGGGCV